MDNQTGFQSKVVSKRITGIDPIIILNPGRSVWITDIITTGNISLFLEDGVNLFEIGNFNGNFSHTFNGIFTTWRESRITAKGEGTVMMVFIPVFNGKDYNQWLYLNKIGGNYG